MPAKISNKNYDFETPDGVKGRLFHIKIPFPVNLRIKPEGKNVGSTSLVYNIPRYYSEKDQIIMEGKAVGMNVLDVEQLSFTITDLCPKCKRRGIPSIQFKNTDSKYYTTAKNFDKSRNSHVFKGKKKYWLVFSHKSTPKLCWINQWQGTKQGTFKPKTKTKDIDPRLFLISQAIKEMGKNHAINQQL